MLGTIIRLMTNGSDLLGAEMRLIMLQIARIALSAAIFLMLAVLAAAAFLALGAGAAAAIAAEIGWPLALIAVGGATLLIVALAALLVSLSLKRALSAVEPSAAKGSPVPSETPQTADSAHTEIATARRDILAAKRRLHRALHGGKRRSGDRTTSESLSQWGLKALAMAVRNPEAVVAGTFAIASVAGPTRVFRLASRAAGAVSMAATVSRLLKRQLDSLNVPPGAPVNGTSRWSAM